VRGWWQAHEQQEALRAAANEKIGTLEDSIEELQRTIAQQQKRMDEMESEHAAECDRLRDEGEDAVEAMREAEAETDLKRLASRKLKEEIIDNDRLTVANINRIRHLVRRLPRVPWLNAPRCMSFSTLHVSRCMSHAAGIPIPHVPRQLPQSAHRGSASLIAPAMGIRSF
jgi:uncharacterized coiled-coil protein SlyX